MTAPTAPPPAAPAKAPVAAPVAAVPQAAPSLAPQDRVQVFLATGERASIDKSELSALGAAGGRPLSGEELHKEYIEETKSGALDALETFVTSTGNALTFGALDRGIVAIGGNAARKNLADTREGSPVSNVLGTVAGVGLPALASGGTSLLGRAGIRAGVAGAEAAGAGAVSTAARIASAPVRAVSALGAGAGKAATRALGLEGATSLGGRVAEGAVSLGAATATEGAVYGTAQQLDEDLIQDQKTTAGKLAAAAGYGFLFGAPLGGGLGAGGAIASATGKAIGKVAGQARAAVKRGVGRVFKGAGDVVAEEAGAASGVVTGEAGSVPQKSAADVARERLEGFISSPVSLTPEEQAAAANNARMRERYQASIADIPDAEWDSIPRVQAEGKAVMTGRAVQLDPKAEEMFWNAQVAPDPAPPLSGLADEYDAMVGKAAAAPAKPPIAASVAPEIEAIAARPPVPPAAVRKVDDAFEAYVAKQKDPEVQAAMRTMYEEQKNVGKVAADADAELDASARRVVSSGNRAAEAETNLNKVAFGEGREEWVAKLVDPKTADEALRIAREARNEAKGLLYEVHAVGPHNVTFESKKLEKLVANFDDKWELLNRAKPADAARDAFLYVQELKQGVGRLAKMGANPVTRSASEAEMFKLYDKLKVSLESQAWGTAGAANKAINEATTQKLELGRRLRKAFQHGDQSVEGNLVTEFNAGALKNYLKDINGAQADGRREALKGWISGLREQFDAVEAFVPSAERLRGEFATGRKALKEFEGELARAEAAATATSKADKELAKAVAALEKEKAGRVGAVVGEVGGGVLGGWAGSYAGRAVGALSDAMGSPIATAKKMGQARHVAERLHARFGGDPATVDRVLAIQRVAGRVDASIARGVQAFVDGTAKTGKLTAKVLAYQGARPTREEAIRTAEVARTLASNPQAAQERVNAYIGAMAHGAPNMSGATAILAHMAIQNAAARAPTPQGTQWSVTPTLERTRYDEVKVSEFRDYLHGLQHPLSVLGDLQAGRVSKHKVAAIKENHPDVWPVIQEKVLLAINSQKVRPSYEKRIALGAIFDIPTDWTVEPAGLKALQQAHVDTGGAESDVAADAQSRGPSRPLRGGKAEAMRTGSDRLGSK